MGAHPKPDPHLWIFSEIYFPEETSTGFILTGIAEGLAQGQSGRVSVITGPGRITVDRRRRQERRGVTIYRVGRGVRWRTRLASRLWHGISLSVRIAWQGWRRMQKGDMALVVTNPPLLPLLVALACGVRRIPYVVLVHDVYPHALASMGVIGRHGVVFRVARWVQRRILNGAGRVVVLGHRMGDLIADDFGVEPRRIREIPNWADTELVMPDEEAGRRFRTEAEIRESFVVLHAGNMGRTHDMETLLEAADRLRGEGIHFLFIGSGACAAMVRQRAEDPRSNVTLLPSLPRSRQREFLNAGHVSVIAFKPGMAGVSVPSRLYNILASGRPTILMGGEGSEAGQILEGERVGWAFGAGAVDDLVSALIEARDQPSLRREMGDRARRLAERSYARQVIVHRWQQTMGELLPHLLHSPSPDAGPSREDVPSPSAASEDGVDQREGAA